MFAVCICSRHAQSTLTSIVQYGRLSKVIRVQNSLFYLFIKCEIYLYAEVGGAPLLGAPAPIKRRSFSVERERKRRFFLNQIIKY